MQKHGKVLDFFHGLMSKSPVEVHKKIHQANNLKLGLLQKLLTESLFQIAVDHQNEKLLKEGKPANYERKKQLLVGQSLYKQSIEKMSGSAGSNHFFNFYSCGDQNDPIFIPSKFYYFSLEGCGTDLELDFSLQPQENEEEEYSDTTICVINTVDISLQSYTLELVLKISSKQRIKHLYLEGSNMTALNHSLVPVLSPATRVLSFHQCEMPRETILEVLQNINTMNKMNSIFLRHIEFGDEGGLRLAESIKSWGSCTHLEVLFVGWNNMSPNATCEILKAINACSKQLRELVFGDYRYPSIVMTVPENRVSGCLSKFIPNITHKGFPYLEKLSFQRGSLTREDIIHLTWIFRERKLPRLKELNLSGRTQRLTSAEDDADYSFLNTMVAEVDTLIETMQHFHRWKCWVNLAGNKFSKKFEDRWKKRLEISLVRLVEWMEPLKTFDPFPDEKKKKYERGL